MIVQMNIDYYLIHCEEHPERIPHIEWIKSRVNQPIEIFKGIFTKYYSLNHDSQRYNATMYDPNIQFYDYFFWMPGQLGCYLSHHLLIKGIANREYTEEGYSVILEDDAVFGEGLHETIFKLVTQIEERQIDIDILYLGNLNEHHGVPLFENVYTLDPLNECWGTHAILIRNSSAKKIYEKNCVVRGELDKHYKWLIDNKELNGFVVYPPLCAQESRLPSTIWNNTLLY